MLEQLMGLMQDHSQDAIVNNPAVPNEHNDGAMQAILGSVLGGLTQNQGGGGGLAGLLSGAMGGGNSGLMGNPIVSGIAQNAIGSLMDKFGIENAAAKQIVASVLPSLLSSMANKHNDPNDSFNIGDLAGAVLGGQQQGGGGGLLGSILGNVLGGGGNQQGGGGLGGLLGGLLGGK
jgi:hypothetical protein